MARVKIIECPRDAWQPDVVVVNQGTNDGGMPAKEYQPLYARYLSLIRSAYPKAKIVAVRPFCGAQADSMWRTAFSAFARPMPLMMVNTPGRCAAIW